MDDLERAANPKQQTLIDLAQEQIEATKAQTEVINNLFLEIEIQGRNVTRQYKKWCRHKKISVCTTFAGISIALAFSIADYVRSGEQSLLAHILKFIRLAIL